MKLAFYTADMFLDMVCLVNFFRSGLYGFAGSQLMIIMVSFALQLRKSTPRQLLEAMRESWLVGLPCNLLRLGCISARLSYTLTLAVCVVYLGLLWSWLIILIWSFTRLVGRALRY